MALRGASEQTWVINKPIAIGAAVVLLLLVLCICIKIRKKFCQSSLANKPSLADPLLNPAEPARVPSRSGCVTLEEPVAWQYDPAHTKPIGIRREPKVGGDVTGKQLQPGEEFMVSEEKKDENSGVRYLKLADGRGWLFDVNPGVGQMCIPSVKVSASPKKTASESKTVICISDIHGNAVPLRTLWRKLELDLGKARFDASAVVFLGDYCDRGPQTRQTLDCLCEIKKLRTGHNFGTTAFIVGNHCFGMAAFLGCIPADVMPPDLDKTNKGWTDGFWPHNVAGGMHYIGRRWGGSRSFQARYTFQSYGLEFDERDASSRDKLNKAVPEAHKEFLRSLKWVHEEDVDWKPGRVVCVHAGLHPNKTAGAQLIALRGRDLTDPALWMDGDPGRITAFQGRAEVRSMHPDLDGTALLVSGHHGEYFERGDRIINDRSGGYVANAPLEALILPERRRVTSE